MGEANWDKMFLKKKKKKKDFDLKEKNILFTWFTKKKKKKNLLKEFSVLSKPVFFQGETFGK